MRPAITAVADSAFDAASAAMSPKDRCKWTSAELLLDEDGRSAYGHMNCDERIAANTRIWWMSRPLFSDSTEDRRSEDYARKVLIQLHSALPWDERYDWRKRFGGEAVSEMMVRYGWPAFSAYGGDYEEESHANWMHFYDSTRTATAEYPQDRVHLIPQWNAIADPFRASGRRVAAQHAAAVERRRAGGPVVAQRALRARPRRHRAVA